jgi:molybdopterin synthase catalytic subunit
MSIVARLEERELDPGRELAALLSDSRNDGAVVTFAGMARPKSKCGELVDRLVLEHHPTLTQRSLEEIAASAAKRFDVSHVRVVHRYGTVRTGEAIVFAGASSQHRRAAFEAADYLMDCLKTEATFWKQEIGEGRAEWIEPTEGDYADRERWD